MTDAAKLPPPPPRTLEHVAVLMGGWSAEREISLKSGSAVAAGLEAEGYRVTTVDVGRDLAARLKDIRPDACFNALHGRWGEDGCVQGLLECMGLRYTHSGVLASALAMHKEHAKTAMRAAGVPVAEAVLATRTEAAARHVMAPPYVLKPVCEGSSVGIAIVRDAASPPPDSVAQGAADELVMAERYVPGRELTCATLGDFVTGVTEIKPEGGLAFYDFEAKYSAGGSSHILPARISSDVYELTRQYTQKANRALGCRGVARADFRYDDTPNGAGELICLEVNTQPGMTNMSLVPELAAYAGWSFSELVRWIIEDSSCRR